MKFNKQVELQFRVSGPHDVQNNECLVTDLVHELSSSLEIPFLLSEDIKAVNKLESVSPLDNTFYEEPWKEDWSDGVFNQVSNCKSSAYVKNEIIDDFQSYLDESITTQTSNFSGSGNSNGSGSECSSTEIWVSKNEFDTPPVTPPDERVSPDSVFILPSEDLRFMPIKVDNNLPSDAKMAISSCKKVRIQPKPLSTMVNIVGSHNSDSQAVLCNVFSSVNPNKIKNQNCLLESQVLLNLVNGKKKSVLSRKDMELLQAKRKQERMIRNRESAYLSRKRKKEHVAHLENQVQELLTENNQLRLENCSLRQRLAKYEKVDYLPSGKTSKNIFTESTKKTTAVLALLFTFCLNIGSFSSFLNERRGFQGENVSLKENLVPLYSSEMRHTRSLLWVEEFVNLNSTFANSSKTSCPVFINQSESIRLESELRRWIRGDEDYSRPSKRNISKINQYFYSGEKTHINSKRKQKSRSHYSNHKKGNLKMNMYHMKPNLFNIESFFEVIHRRDDTFYLVSFSSDHLLLPALSHNKTSRPKMSLMLPGFLSNDTGTDQVEMMQIDCEVTNTQLLSVNENNIPSYMKTYINSTSHHKSANETKSEFFVNVAKNIVPAKQREFEIENFKTSQNEAYPLVEKNLKPKTYFNFSWIGKSKIQKNNNFYRQNQKEAENMFANKIQNQEATNSGRNLLKSLIVGPANAKGVGNKVEKLLQKDLKNGTNFLYN